jgi:hypothetical protein
MCLLLPADCGVLGRGGSGRKVPVAVVMGPTSFVVEVEGLLFVMIRDNDK